MERSSVAIILVTALVTACGNDGETADASHTGLAPRTDASIDVDSQRLGEPATSLPERPATMRDTITANGVERVETFDLVRSPPGFILPFSTYMPEDLAVEFDTAGTTDLVTFSGGAGGEAFMMVAIYPAGTTALQVEDTVRQLVVSRAPGIDASSAVSPPSWGQWAVELSYPESVGEWVAGSAVIAQYGPRFFHVLRLFPARFADEIRPALDAVLEHWRWDDTGRMLTSGDAGGG